jgi:hypothetical protein
MWPGIRILYSKFGGQTLKSNLGRSINFRSSLAYYVLALAGSQVGLVGAGQIWLLLHTVLQLACLLPSAKAASFDDDVDSGHHMHIGVLLYACMDLSLAIKLRGCGGRRACMTNNGLCMWTVEYSSYLACCTASIHAWMDGNRRRAYTSLSRMEFHTCAH